MCNFGWFARYSSRVSFNLFRKGELMPLTCDQYDFLEIACMFHYDLSLTLSDCRQIRGVADSLIIDENRVETLLLSLGSDQQESGNVSRIKVATSEIKCLEVLTKGARFSKVNFV